MMEFLLLLGVLALAYVGYRAWNNGQQRSSGSAAPKGPGQGTIEDVRAGGVIQLPPHGADMEELDVEITARHVYSQGRYQWHELEGHSGRGTVWLDVERDDELETSVTLKRMTLEELGLTQERLDASKPDKSLTLDGQTFRFSEQGRARFCPNGDTSRPEALEFWDFEGDDDRHDLCIERWDTEYRVYLSQRLNPARIRIYSLGDDT